VCGVRHSAFGIPQRIHQCLEEILVEVCANDLETAMKRMESMEMEKRLHVESYTNAGGSSFAMDETSYVSTLLVEKNKSDALLYQMLPRHYADRVKGGATSIADHHDSVSVLFADICGFTRMASDEGAGDIVKMLDHIFFEFDTLAEKMGLLIHFILVRNLF
jgi:hypothetical protein